MSAGSGNGNAGGKERLEEAIAARGRADLVSGLRGLARRQGTTTSRQDVAAGAGLDRSVGPGTSTPAPGSAAAAADEHCDLCGSPISADHRHLLHLDERRMLCSCETCWNERSGEPSYRPAGARVAWLGEFELPDEAWASFQIPIGLAFFMRTGDPVRTFAFYPSPAGATESEIDEAAWQRLTDLNPQIGGLERDCEALIINRMSDQHQFAVAPIDECYRLVGMIKTTWEGISGGSGPQEAIERFFAELRIRSATGAARMSSGAAEVRLPAVEPAGGSDGR
ncbi:MAG: DUF5947 family protein [Solirubrobacterales bacterium]